MAKGKYSTRAENRRAANAEARVAELEEQLRVTQAEHGAEKSEMKLQIGALQAQLARDVKAMSESEVQRVRAEYTATLAKERGDRSDRVKLLSKLLSRHNVKLPASGWAEVCEIFQVQMGDIANNDGQASRAWRRGKRSHLKKSDAEHDEAQRIRSGIGLKDAY